MLVIPTFCSLLLSFLSCVLLWLCRVHLLGSQGVGIRELRLCIMSTEDWQVEKEVRRTILCIPVHSSVVLGVTVFLPNPSAMFPCPIL